MFFFSSFSILDATQNGHFKDLEFCFLFMFLILNVTFKLKLDHVQQRCFKKPGIFAFFFFLNTKFGDLNQARPQPRHLKGRKLTFYFIFQY